MLGWPWSCLDLNWSHLFSFEQREKQLLFLSWTIEVFNMYYPEDISIVGPLGTRHWQWRCPIDRGPRVVQSQSAAEGWSLKHLYMKDAGIKGRKWGGAWCRGDWKFRDLFWWSPQNQLSPYRWKEKEWFTEKLLGSWSCWGNALRTKEKKKVSGSQCSDLR